MFNALKSETNQKTLKNLKALTTNKITISGGHYNVGNLKALNLSALPLFAGFNDNVKTELKAIVADGLIFKTLQTAVQTKKDAQDLNEKVKLLFNTLKDEINQTTFQNLKTLNAKKITINKTEYIIANLKRLDFVIVDLFNKLNDVLVKNELYALVTNNVNFVVLQTDINQQKQVENKAEILFKALKDENNRLILERLKVLKVTKLIL